MVREPVNKLLTKINRIEPFIVRKTTRISGKSNFLHDSRPFSHTIRQVHDSLDALKWDVLSYAAHSLGLSPSDYYLIALVRHALAEQRFIS